jgi:2-polyprenyl-6-methoxyphenol hydroxylase-like FAD-dependent oxidoreductase
MTTQKYDIAIVGGGTAGAASAIFLSRAGHRVTLFERVPQPGAVGAGILLQPTGMAVLQALGLLEQILAHGARNIQLFGTNQHGRRVLDVRYSDWNPHGFGLGLHRGVLFSILWQALLAADIQVRTAVEVTGISRQGSKATLHQGDASPGAFDCIIVADGTRSQLRAALSIPYKVKPYPWGALWAVLPDEGFTPGVLRQWFRHAHQMLGLMPTGFTYRQLNQPVVSLFWSLRADRLDAWLAAGLDAWKETVLSLAPIAPVLAHITAPEQLTYASYADVRMPYWHDGQVGCIGDCAHATSPQLGQGANLALVDAMTLAQCFAAGDNVSATLATYSRRRTAHLRYYQGASKLLTPFFQSDSRAAALLRDVGLGLVGRAPFVRTQMAQTLSGTKTGWLFGSLPAVTSRAAPSTAPPAQTPVLPDSPTAQ